VVFVVFVVFVFSWEGRAKRNARKRALASRRGPARPTSRGPCPFRPPTPNGHQPVRGLGRDDEHRHALLDQGLVASGDLHDRTLGGTTMWRTP